MVSVDIEAVERTLEAHEATFERTFDWDDGWTFTVDGTVVGRGASIGALEQDLAPWWADYAPTLDPPEAGRSRD